MIVCNSIFQNASTNSTESLGMAILNSRQFFTEANWFWIGTAATVGFLFVFNIGYTLSLTYLNRECLYLLCFGTPKVLELRLLRFVQNVQHLRSLKLWYRKSLTMPKLEEILSYHHLKPQLTKLHPQVMKLIHHECRHLCACCFVILTVHISSLTKFKLNI